MTEQQNPSNESDTLITSARALIHACVSPAVWRELIEKQVALAREGNKGALELLLEYGFGRPISVATQAEEESKPVQMLYVCAPKPNGEYWTLEDGAVTEINVGKQSERKGASD